MTTEQINDSLELLTKAVRELITDKALLSLLEEKTKDRFLDKRKEVLEGLTGLQLALKASRKDKKRTNAWLPKE
jgi:hypothetical protein